MGWQPAGGRRDHRDRPHVHARTLERALGLPCRGPCGEDVVDDHDPVGDGPPRARRERLAQVPCPRLRVELAPGMTSVHGDPQRLTQVFSNLLNNASRRTPAGGDIVLAIVAGDAQVAISVAHEGVGIAPDALPHDLACIARRPLGPISSPGNSLSPVAPAAKATKASVGVMTPG